MRLTPYSLAFFILTACTTHASQPYYLIRDAYSADLDAGADYAEWCDRQADQSKCAPVVVKTVSLEAIARTEIFNAKARVDSGSRIGVAIAEAASTAAVKRLTDYEAAHFETTNH